MTDEDIYAKALGKRFKHVRGELCRIDAEPADSARCVADYVKRELARSVENLTERCAAIVKELEIGQTLFGRDELVADLDRSACDNLGTQHIANAFHRTIDARGDAMAFFRCLAELGITATCARIAVDGEFRDDAEFTNAYNAISPQIIETYAQLLAKRHMGELSDIHERPKTNSDDLLEIVIARLP